MKHLLVASVLVLAACGGSSAADVSTPDAPAGAEVSTAPPDDDVTTPAAIARLDPGTHIGVAGFSPPDAAVTDEWLARWDEAQEAASVGRVLLDWVDVEPERGVYDTRELEEQLDFAVRAGQQPMVTIAAIDVSGTPFPEWLGVDTEDFEPATLIEAYNAMFDHISPILDEYGVWLLAVANEPPFADGLDRSRFAAFVSGVRDHVVAASPDLELTFVFAGFDALSSEPGTAELLDAGTVLAANHYCLDEQLGAVSPDRVVGRIDEYVDAAAGRPVVFQEFGCPASDLLGSSEQHQAEWFQNAFAAIDERPTVRAAFVFEFLDWSDELVDASYGDAFAAEPGLAEYFDRLRAWLTTSGLFRDDMTPRPAWDVFLAAAGG